MKRRIGLLAASVLAAGVLGGCAASGASGASGASTPASSDPKAQTTVYSEVSTVEPVNDYTFLSDSEGLFVYRDGRMISKDVEIFEQSYYDIDELKRDYIEPAITKYNSAVGGERVKLDSLVKEKNNAVLQISYASTKDYLDFQKQTDKYFADFASVEVFAYNEANAKGYSIPVEVVSAAGEIISYLNIEDTDKLNVCVFDLGTGYPTGFTADISFEGDVAYVSGQVNRTGVNTVTLANESGLQFIIFK